MDSRDELEDTPTPPVSIPQPATPMGEDDPLNPHQPPPNVSPSFDYHEERRAHLNDEIWLSHHLPRLPPSSISNASASASTSPIAFTTIPADRAGNVPPPSQRYSQRGSGMIMEIQDDNDPNDANDDNDDGDDGAGLGTRSRKTSAQHSMAGSLHLPGPAMNMTMGQDVDDQHKSGGRSDGLNRLNLAEERDERRADEVSDHRFLGRNTQNGLEGGGQGAQPVAAQENEHSIGSELKSLYGSFARCLEIRDKYMALSCQRLGDNPRDHDGTFHGFQPPGAADVNGLKPEVNQEQYEYPSETTSKSGKESDPFPAWKIYPAPPPPHWHWKPVEDGIRPEHAGAGENGNGGDLTPGDQGKTLNGDIGDEDRAANRSGGGDSHAFRFESCEIPGEAEIKCDFGLNDEGVFEVWYMDDDPSQAGPSHATATVRVSKRQDKTISLPKPLEKAINGLPGNTGQSQSQSDGHNQEVERPGQGKKRVSRVPSLKEYFTDLDYLLGVCCDGPAKSFAFRRLKYLTSKWSMYCLLNEYQELADMKAVPHRDFYNVRKVDTHIHHSASMNQKHLLRFIKSKLKKVPNEIVIHRDGKDLTLQEVFESLKLTAYDLSIDTLDMHAHQEFHRFDRFNDRYNPTGSSRLREIFLKTDNLLKGKYLAELTQELITDLEQSKYQHVEWRLSIYGRSMAEWDKLAKWVINNKLLSHNVRWLIQVPRLYNVYKSSGQVESFEDIVKNVFQPLFEVTKDPSSHPELHVFLQRVVGFDSVDDESKPERRLYRKYPTARMWTTTQSPPYAYWIYYMYANMASLNCWRQARGFNTFVLRPHCGEAGDTDHLSSAYLTSHSISHGILLRKVPALQYLFYLKQIGLAMSPLSNNALFLTYERNPFKDFFRTGLNVSLSTDDPLQFHFTASQLLEEYSCAAQIYKLTPADMCELARNSVIQSGWEMQVKKHWIGQTWYLPGAAGNDIHKTNVPTIRLAYRHSTLLEELTLIHHGYHSPNATPTHLRALQPGSPIPNPAARLMPGTNTTTTSTTGGTSGNNRPGVPVTAGDVGAAAMAMTQAIGAGGAAAGAGGVGVGGGSAEAVAQSMSMSLGGDKPRPIDMSSQGHLRTNSGVGIAPMHLVEGPSALDEKARRKRSMSSMSSMKGQGQGRDAHEMRR